MAHPPALATYLLISRQARRFAERRLANRLARGRETPDHVDERRGIHKTPRPEGKLIWFNAVSPATAAAVGELAERLMEDFDDLNFLVTCNSSTTISEIDAWLDGMAHAVSYTHLTLPTTSRV